MAKVGDHVLGVGTESTSAYGTAVAPDKRFEVVSENLALKQDYIESKSLKASRRYLSTNGHIVGKSHVQGDVEIEIPSAGAGFWFKQLMGKVVTSTPGGATTRRLHTFTADSDLDTLSFTTEIARTDVAGTAHKFTYAGCGITDMEIACKAGEIATMKSSIFGKTETVSAASATNASYADSTPLVFSGAVVKLDTVAVNVSDFSVKIENGRKTDRYFLGASTPAKPIEADMRSCEGKLTVDWEGLTQYNKFTGHSTVAIVAKFETQAVIESSVKGYVQITIPAAIFTGETPTGGGDIVEQSIDFKALDDGTNEPVKIEYLSLDTTV